MKVLKFYADWCAPCKVLTNTIEMYYNGDVEIESVNIESDMDKAIEYKVRGVPLCILLDDNGNELKRKSGTMLIDEFEDFVKA